MTELTDNRLHIHFHGRVIEHLGIDMYQSPVAAIAELVSNAWDADASAVEISLPIKKLGSGITVSDNGDGMTFKECQERFLKVGYNRRAVTGTDLTQSGRPVMGRKGIGKFAGFGIAELVEIDTISKETGEHTKFILDIVALTHDDSYSSEPMEVEVLAYEGPDEARKESHGTRFTLKSLTLKRSPNPEQFRASMARRFLLLERAENFRVAVNGTPISEDSDVESVEFDYPADYERNQKPNDLVVDNDGWGIEELSNGERIRWRFVFYKEPIKQEELSGISIFSRYKLAQKPFAFNLSGGFGGQHGINYLSGRVQADYIDDQQKDLISTERQRINWESEDARPLLDWGQNRIRSLLRLWQERRAAAKVDAMNQRLTPFSERLARLEQYEQKVVRRALSSLARIPALSDEQFADLSNAILMAWEGGRLQDLISTLSDSSDLDADKLVEILVQSRVMSALHAAERVKVQLELLKGLEERIRNRELENAIRDYIAENPWMISPEWETFRQERSLDKLIKEIGKEQLDKERAWDSRVDLVLRSGDQLLVIEFMRPGKTADLDHITRFQRYIDTLREVTPVRHSDVRSITGLMVADKLEKPSGFKAMIDRLRKDGMDATDWNGLLQKARSQWQDYFEILFSRAPEDNRMKALASDPIDIELDAKDTREQFPELEK
ncbi:ATP-binding protein [Nocardia sp. BMG111209]|uniref:ATP-binding protein n=1 Tax=Nocardia sp. BMG111209 TaxID=1160137 RepID=UPI0018CBD35A|nr:ATP-binding protein [Nocardia sp. BMG111209]